MKILIFGGTTEGRLLGQELLALGAEVTVSVATQLGGEALANRKGLTLWVGRKNADELAECVSGYDQCIDATHPYAVEATANIKSACLRAGIPLRRLLRPASPTDGVIQVDSCGQAAEFLSKQTGNILLTTGAKELSAFASLDKNRLFARVLPSVQGICACEEIGLPHRNILALQGPFGQKLNEAMLEQYQISWLVTKDGGTVGGFLEKIQAAKALQIPVILVGRPADAGESMEEILSQLREKLL